MNNRQQNKRIITPEHIQLITGMDEQAAEREYNYVRNFIGVQPDQFTIKSYCKHNGLSVSEIKAFLFPTKNGFTKFMNQAFEPHTLNQLELNI